MPDYCLRAGDEKTLRSWIVPQMRSMRREVVLFHPAERAGDEAFKKLVGRLVSELRRLVAARSGVRFS